MRILLTGGSGLVGSNIADHKNLSEHDLIAPSSSELDLLNFTEVSRYLTRCAPDLVIHAAGRVGGIQANIRQPVDFLVDNLDMGKNIILASRQANVKKLLNLGSSCMYPKGINSPLTEDLSY